MIKPTFKLETRDLGNHTAEVVIEPLPRNFGHTIGNALRRVLLGSLPGAAAVRVKIAGISHQFSTLEGVQEDILDFLLNLKETRFVLETDDNATVKLAVKGKKTITASDLELPAGVKIANPDQVLAHLTSDKAKLVATIEVITGLGYIPAEQHSVEEIGVIPMDASFSPILKANYKVESTRVGRRTDLDRVRLTLATDGTVSAEKAVTEAAKILHSFFEHVHSPTFIKSEEEAETISSPADQPLEDIDLPVRVINALKKGGFKYITDLAGLSVADLTKVKNIGEKSAEEIITKVKQKLQS